MGNQASAADLANKKLELPKELRIRDEREKFKLKFPFYRMDIQAFEYKLNHIEPTEIWSTQSAYTEVMTIEQFKNEFCNLPTIEKNWDRIERLFKNNFFRELLFEDEVQSHRSVMEQKISKIDVGILGFLWCNGSKEKKAQYLFNLAKTSKKPGHTSNMASTSSMRTNTTAIQEGSADILVWTNRNLKHIFVQLFRVAIDLPWELREEFGNDQILDQETLIKQIDNLKADLENPNLAFYDFLRFEHKLAYHELFEEWFIANVFGTFNAKINSKKFIKKLSKKQNLEYMFNPFDLREKFKKTQIWFDNQERKRILQQQNGILLTKSEFDFLKEDSRSTWEQLDDWFWYENQSDFENQTYLIPYHLFTGVRERYVFFKNKPSLQKVTRYLAIIPLTYILFQQSQISIQWEYFVILPNISLVFTLFSSLVASYVSFREEELGEDGLEVESEEESDLDVTKPRFQLESSRDPKHKNPKYSLMQKWKIYTIVYQMAVVMQGTTLVMWGVEFAKVEEYGEDKGKEKNIFEEVLTDYMLHVVPTVVLAIEFLVNSQPFIDRHFWTTTFPFLCSLTLFTIILELYFSTKLYQLDYTLAGISLPLYSISSILVSIPLFYLFQLLTYLKLKIQGYPCDKILEEIEEYFEKMRESEKIDIEREIVPINNDQVRSIEDKF